MSGAPARPATPRRPRPLPDGGTIALIAPSSGPYERSELERAVEHFEEAGYRVRLGEHVWERHGYHSARDAGRAADLQWALTDPGVDLVLPFSGGVGCARLVSLLDWDAIRAARPRALCGYSDITVLHLALRRYAGWLTFHGPNAARFASPSGRSEVSWGGFLRALRGEIVGEVPRRPADPWVGTLCGGRAEAPFVGGNLSLVNQAGLTPWALEPEGCIVLLEEVESEPYSVDTWLTHLRDGGFFEGVAGIVLAEAVEVVPFPYSPGYYNTLSYEDVLHEVVAPLGIPAIFGLPLGHGAENVTVPLGARAALDADAGTLTILESGCEEAE